VFVGVCVFVGACVHAAEGFLGVCLFVQLCSVLLCFVRPLRRS
jgi:hypothetical protein